MADFTVAVVDDDAAIRRLRLSLGHQGVDSAEVTAQVSFEERHYQALLDALAGVKVVLDSACGFVINR